ncbi:MAG: VOC family protein [Nitrososphaerales archaeon]
MFRKIDAMVLLVSNMKRSVDFYKKTLGLPLRTSTPDWAEFFTDGTKLALHPMKKKSDARSKSRVGMLVGFMTSSMDEISESLRKKKVKFIKQPKEESFGKHAIILDPDGYMISIVQLKAKASEEVDLFGGLGIE